MEGGFKKSPGVEEGVMNGSEDGKQLPLVVACGSDVEGDGGKDTSGGHESGKQWGTGLCG